MQLYRPVPVDGYEWIQPISTNDFDRVYQPQIGRDERWPPIRVKTIAGSEHADRTARADMPWLGGHAIVLRERARQSLDGLLADFGEFIDLQDQTEHLWLFHATRVVDDALDEEASVIRRFPSTGRVMSIDSYAFRAAPLQNLHAFHIPMDRSLFVSEAVVDAAERSALKGTGFRLVWHGQIGG